MVLSSIPESLASVCLAIENQSEADGVQIGWTGSLMMTLALQLLIQSFEQRIHKEQNALGEEFMALESCVCVCAACTGWQYSLILTQATYLVSVQH